MPVHAMKHPTSGADNREAHRYAEWLNAREMRYAPPDEYDQQQNEWDDLMDLAEKRYYEGA